jgi:NNP family nitrate/nitrite transporter-like MFS transporter
VNKALIRDGSNKNMDESSAPLSSQVGPLFLLTGIFFLNFICRIILAPLMPTIEKDLGIGHGEAGALFLLISLGYFAALMGSGFFSSRLTHRKTIILSSMVSGAALLGVSISHTMWGIRLGLVIVGMAAGLYLPSGIITLTALVRSRDWGKAIAIHEIAPNLGFVVAPLLSETLLIWFSWRYILVLLGIASVCSGLSFARFGRGGKFPGESPRPGTLRILMGDPSFWIMVALFSLGIGASIGIYSMLPLYLVAEREMVRSWANYLVAISRISALGIGFLSGIVTDRLGPKVAMGGVFLGTGLITLLLGVVPGSWIVLIVFLQPMMAACFFPPGFAALSRIGPPRVRNISLSFTFPPAFLLGGGAIPAGIGVLGEMGFFDLGISLVGGIVMSGFIVSHYLRFPEE